MQFARPVRGTNVHLPEMYGGFNLTKLSTILDTPLQMEPYDQELRMLEKVADTAQKSLAGMLNVLLVRMDVVILSLIHI